MADISYNADINTLPMNGLTTGSLIEHPFVWVNKKSQAFEYSNNEYTGNLKTDNNIKSYYQYSVIFIEDTGEIWAGGKFFGLSNESIGIINANFGQLNKSITEIQNTYVTTISADTPDDHAGAPFIAGFTLSKDNNTHVYKIKPTYAGISIGSSNSAAANKTISGIGVGNDGKTINITYQDILLTISANKTDGTGNGTAPVVDIIPGTNGITYKTGKIGYENISITDSSSSQELPAYLADIKRNISDLTTLTSQGIVFRETITALPSAARVGDAYVFSADYTDGTISYNKGDMVIATAVNGNTITWTGIEHNIDNSTIISVVNATDTADTKLYTTNASTIGTVAGTNLTAKLGYASRDDGGAIRVASNNKRATTINAQATSNHHYYGVYLNSDNIAYVDVPWTDTQVSLSGGTGGQIVTSISQSGKNITVTTGNSSAEQKSNGTGVYTDNNAYIKIGAAEIGITGKNDITVTYNTNGDKNIQISYVHGLTTTAGAITAHDNDTVSHFNKAVSGITVSAHQVTPTYTTIASYTYIENQIQRAYDHANSVAAEAAALKWVVI